MEWKKELKKLEYPYKQVTLLIDGKHKVTYESCVNKMRVVIGYYYDGVFKGEYCMPENEIGQMFGRPRYGKMSQKLFKLLWRSYGKKEATKQKEECQSKVIGYSVFWLSVAMLIKHLSKFEKIEVLNEND